MVPANDFGFIALSREASFKEFRFLLSSALENTLMAFKQPGPFDTRQRAPGASEEALRQASAAIHADRPADAERIASELLKANSGNRRAMQLLGTALLMQNRNEEAIAQLERVARQGRDPAVETQLAIALRELGRDEEAVARLRRAIKSKPPFPQAYFELGTLLASLGQTDEAIDVLKRAAEHAPSFVELWIELGSVYASRSRYAEAREAYSRALAIGANHQNALLGLAETLRNTGDYKGAAEIFRRVLEITPQHANARLGLGVCLLELGLTDPGFNNIRMAAADPRMYGSALFAVSSIGRGRLWLRPSVAKKFLRGEDG